MTANRPSGGDIPIEPTSFDLIVLGTGLPESLVASAAARAGKSVLQLDGSERFGGEWGTLALDEFAEWIRDRRRSDDDGTAAAAAVSTPSPSSSSADGEERRVSFLTSSSSSPSSSPLSSSIYLDPRFEAEELSDKQRARRYAVDLSPKLLHCDGATVDALLAAGAGSYAEFKLVGAHLVWVREEEEAGGGEKEAGQGEVEKEGRTASAAAAAGASTSAAPRFARGRLLPLPASRADVFRDRSLPLAAKRGVMRFLQQAADAVLGRGGPLAGALSVEATDDQGSSSSSSSSSVPFAAVVASANLPRGVANAVIYGLAGADADQGPWEKGELATAATAAAATTTTTTTTTTTATTATAATAAFSSAPWASAPLPSRAAALSLRRHLLSLGRYGGSSALLAALHGSGELPQAFVRSAAVAGGAAALRRPVAAAFLLLSGSAAAAGEEKHDGSARSLPPRVTAVELASGQRLECGALAGGREPLRALLPSPPSPSPSPSPRPRPPRPPFRLLPRVARCVAVLDGPPALSSSSSPSSPSSELPELLSAATAALVFPPRCLSCSCSSSLGGEKEKEEKEKVYPRDAVRGLVLSGATASAPEGRWLLHLSTPLARREGERGDGGEEGEGEGEKVTAEAALFGVLSALARPPEGCKGPSSSSSTPLSLPPRALDHRPSALLVAFYEAETGFEAEGGGAEDSSLLLLPRNAAATAAPDGRPSADDGPLASARGALERLFPGEGVERLLLEKKKKEDKKKKKKSKGTDNDDDDTGNEEEDAPAKETAAKEGQGERDDDDDDGDGGCSSDEDAAGDLAAVLAALDAAAKENE